MAAPIAHLRMTTMIQEPRYCRLDLDVNAEIENALAKGKKGLSMFPDLKSFHESLLKENKLIQKIIRIRQAQLRREKEMQLLKRVKACLQRVHLMDKIFTIADGLLEDVKKSLRGELGHLPCKETLTFLLYLISQYHGLLHQAISYSLSAFQYLTSLITVRQLLQVFVIFMGICARVWQVSKTFSDRLTSVYNHLYPIQQCVPASKLDWVWPDIPPRLTKEGESSPSVQENERACEEFLDRASVEVTGEIKDCSSTEVDDLIPDHPDSEEDVGVAVSIEECQKVMKRKAEYFETGNVHEAKKTKCEDTGVKNTVKKKKKKKTSNVHDTEALCEENMKQRNISELNVTNDIKKQKKKKKKKRTE